MTLKLKEGSFKDQVTELAEMTGWQWVAWRPLRTLHGWSTPYDGPLGKGWPDLTIIRPRDHRQVFAELKSDSGRVEREQWAMLQWLTAALVFEGGLVHVHLWRPTDWKDIVECLA